MAPKSQYHLQGGSRRPVRRRRRRKFRKEFLILVWTLAAVILILAAIFFIRSKVRESSSASSITQSISESESGISSEQDSESEADSKTLDDSLTAAEKEVAAGKAVIESIAAFEQQMDTSVSFSSAVTEGHPYLAAVNRAANTVTIYTDDGSGNYYAPYMAMVCSTGGDGTPLGVWNMPTSEESTSRPIVRAEWHPLDGSVYGQYISRITPNDGILFHSVPYYTNGDKNSLEYDEYNKLGTTASLGCVRLAVIDAKWVYDNLPTGTMVAIYDDADNPGPLGKPNSISIDTGDTERRGWDPTDPDSENPWGSMESTAIYGAVKTD